MDPAEFRAAGHRLIDELAKYLDHVEERPVFPDVEPATLHRLFDEPMPGAGAPLDTVLDELNEKLLPYCTHVSHPGYFGLITPTPTPAGILGDLLASALNQNVGAYSIGPSAVALERRTVRWLTDLVGYDARAGGNLTSGGTMAHFIGLKLARDWASGDRTQHEGVTERWAVYTSEERHVSVDKAVDAVGLGRDSLRALPTDDRFRLDLPALESAITEDRRKGIRPMCIVGMAGTTNIGTVDDLAALRRIADREGMWLHVDAAYGGGVLLSEELRPLLAALALADSVVLDPHKWFYAPLDAGAILVKEEARLTASFGIAPPYLTDRTDEAGERYNYYVHGFEQSRRFRALKVWMALKRYGAREVGRWVEANVALARRLHDLAADDPDFVPATEPPMSAVCLRFAPVGLEESVLAPLHDRVARRIQEGGRYWISTTQMKGRTWFRVNPVNFRSRGEHIEGLFADLRAACAEAGANVSVSGSAS
ncbi:MAG TPA: aminotransferase class I/II-fold pyridoxal phosphate-dependent enzyme [Rubricoccaceae bacterium]|nr:aminotransferase class I/II-fold pyridoxal phosphate-dependent enzyme [Rubricoccaceae bacterium]